ncbi:LPXTG cell wall anchor domain-containing protein [Erwinia sp. CPCC 100877]|nr:LPXTG cell wall anchor domain-containing protein [Erwinia sp. CPCC 100877]
MKKNCLYGVCVLFLFLLQFAPVSSFAESASGTTTAEVTFTQGPKAGDGDDGGKLKPNNNGNNSGIKDDINDFVKKYLPNTGEQQQLYLMIIGTCLIVIMYLVFRLKNEKKESRRE